MENNNDIDYGPLECRAWHTANKVMYSHKNIPVMLKNAKDDNTWKYMQYTGVKDDEGIKIFQGDITGTPENPRVIYRRAGGFWSKQVKGEGNYPITFNVEGLLEGTRVIGNIYQNPELLDENN